MGETKLNDDGKGKSFVVMGSHIETTNYFNQNNEDKEEFYQNFD